MGVNINQGREEEKGDNALKWYGSYQIGFGASSSDPDTR